MMKDKGKRIKDKKGSSWPVGYSGPNINLCRSLSLSLILFFLTVSGCQRLAGGGLPTLVPTAAFLVDTPESEPDALGENGLPVTNTPPPATETLTPTPTRDPTLPTATSTPDRSIEAAVNITTLIKDRYLAGEPIPLSGLARLRSDQRLVTSLTTLDGRVLISETVSTFDFGSWETVVPIDNRLSGQLLFYADILGPDGEPAARDSLRLTIGADNTLDRYLDIYRPAGEMEAVAGYTTFIDGWAQRAVNFVVSIAILDADCRTPLSRQSYTLRGSGYWQGFIVVPAGATGDGCVQAVFGEEGSPDRREALFYLKILPDEATVAAQIKIANPPPEETVAAGERVLVYGTVARPVDNEVKLRLTLDNGALILSETLQPDRWGYWESEVLLPIEVEGNIEVAADSGSARDTILIEVVEQ